MSETTTTMATLEAALKAATARIDALEKHDESEHSELNAGDTAWILTSTALVLMMTIPGLALFYAGMSRKHNALSTVMQSFAITCFVSILWLMFGYSLAFGSSATEYIGGAESFWFQGDKSTTGKVLLPASMSGTIPESLFIIFQMTFAIITAAIITGAVAERMKFSSLLVFIFFWHLLVYCPIAHWEWGGGFMGSWGVLDFAGGDVVHISSGVSGLVAAFIVGKRKAFGQGAELPPHNVLLTFIGASLLWVGWFGFNAGSALSAGTSASMAMLVTHIAACSAGLTWMFTEWLVTGKPTVLGIVSGAIAGLVVITPGAGYVDHTGAFVMGIIGGWGCYLGIQLKHIMGYDDALDAFGVHGVGGIIGGVLTGLFANPAIAEGTAGAFYNNAPQLGWQIAGILVTAAYSAGMTAVILVLIKVTLGLRVSSEDEDLGLDISEHGHAFEEQHKAVTSAGPQVPMVMTPFGLQPVPGFPGGPVPYRP